MRSWAVVLCSLIGSMWFGLSLFESVRGSSDTIAAVHSAEAAVWIVGALILGELSKWRRL